MKRKVIQLIVQSDSEYAQGHFLALCSDGSIWGRSYKYDRDGDGPAYNQRFEWELYDGPPEEII